MKISPSMRSYLDKHPPINVEGKTYVPLGKMSKFDSLAQMVWSGFGKRQRKAEAEQQSASSLEEEVFHPSTTTSVPRVKSRNKRLGIFYFIFPNNFTGTALLSAHGRCDQIFAQSWGWLSNDSGNQLGILNKNDVKI